MIICLASENDAAQIAKIHKEEISEGFLSSLDVSFLEKLYLSVIKSGLGFCVVAKENDDVEGFIAGTVDIDKTYSYFFSKYFFQSVAILLPKVFDLSFLKKSFETLFYPKKESGLVKAELLTIAVKNELQGKGIAGQMFEIFISEMKNRNIKEFKVLVGEELKPAIKFYEKHGFVFFIKTVVHGDKASRVYIYTVKNT